MLGHVQPFATPRALPMGFSRQEYWSGLPLPSPGDLPSPRIEPGSPVLRVDYLPSEPVGGAGGGSLSKRQASCRPELTTQLTPSLSCSVALGKSFYLLESQFTHQENGDDGLLIQVLRSCHVPVTVLSPGGSAEDKSQFSRRLCMSVYISVCVCVCVCACVPVYINTQGNR